MRAVELDDGTLLEVIDVAQVDSVAAAGGAQPERFDVGANLEIIAHAVKEAAASVGSTVRSLANEVRPDKLEVEFGVSITGTMKAVFVGAEGQATFKAKLTWDFGEVKPTSVTDMVAR